jgi:hypothetical protein
VLGARGFGGEAPEFFSTIFVSIFSGFSTHIFSLNGFLISVKELWLYNNLGQWIRGFGCCGILYIYIYIYIYIVNNEYI